jgi:hypothetical protein
MADVDLADYCLEAATFDADRLLRYRCGRSSIATISSGRCENGRPHRGDITCRLR